MPLAECSRDEAARRLDAEPLPRWLERHGLTAAPLKWFIECARVANLTLTSNPTSNPNPNHNPNHNPNPTSNPNHNPNPSSSRRARLGAHVFNAPVATRAKSGARRAPPASRPWLSLAEPQCALAAVLSRPLSSVVRYGMRDDYGTALNATSAWAALHYFAARDAEERFEWPEGNGHIVR